MERLNGWMRLWVLISAPFWVVAIFTAAADVQGPEERSRALEYRSYSQEWKIEGCYPCAFPFVPSDEQITESLANAYADEVSNDYIAALKMAGIVPLGLLALGHGIAWVRRGFRKEKGQ